MTRIPLYQIDAFTSRPFAGNPAAVCALEAWLPDDVLQAIAAENNLSETAFIVPGDGDWHLRWFTPAAEVNLCGHATLATACALRHYLAPGADEYRFSTRSGTLTVTCDDAGYAMDFPARPATPVAAPVALLEALGVAPRVTALSEDYLLVLDNEADVLAVVPDFPALALVPDCRGCIVTAPGRDVDFVSRFFAPAVGVDEDPVTGSAHCTLTPYWSRQLGRQVLTARQVSKRGGDLVCEDRGERIVIRGDAVPVIEGCLLI